MVFTMETWINSQIKEACDKQSELVDVFQREVEDLVKAEASWWKKLIPRYVQRKEEVVAATRKEIRVTQYRLRTLEKKSLSHKRITIDEAGRSLRTSANDLALLREIHANIMAIQATGMNVTPGQLRDSIGHCLDRDILPREELWKELLGAFVAGTPADDTVLQKVMVSKPEKTMGVLKKMLAKHRLVVEGCKANLSKLVDGDRVGADELD